MPDDFAQLEFNTVFSDGRIVFSLPPSLPFSALDAAFRFDFRDPRSEPMLMGFPQLGQVVIAR